MASSRQEKAERAEEAARVAVSEPSDINRERDEAAAKREAEHEQQQQQRSGGVLGTILKAVTGGKTYDTSDSPTREGADVASSDKTAQEKTDEYKNNAAEKAREMKDATVGKTGEYKDYTAEKAKEMKDHMAEKEKEAKDTTLGKAQEYKDSAEEKAKETKDSTAEKMGEYKDYSGEKAREGKEASTGKLSELKDSAAEAARRAMEFLSGKKEETKQKTSETTEAAKEKLGETEEEGQQYKEETKGKMEEMKSKGEEYKDEAGQKAQETKDTEAEKSACLSGTAARGNIFSSIGSLTEAIKEKLTHPSDVVEETREQGSSRRKDSGAREKVVVDMEQTPTGAVASTLKASDQMTGQTFNDVGRMGDEGSGKM